VSRSSWVEDRGERPGLRWRARYRAPDGRIRSKSFRRKVDAERWLTTEMGSVDRGAWTDPKAGEMLLGEWCPVWMAGLTLKPKTRAGYEQLLRSRILPRFGGYPLKSITTAEVRAFVTEIIEEGKVATARQARGLLSQALSTARDDGLIARNPVESVRAPRVDSRSAPVVPACGRGHSPSIRLCRSTVRRRRRGDAAGMVGTAVGRDGCASVGSG
jgi:hypothetical protein